MKADYKDKLIGTFLELNNRTSTILVIYLPCNVVGLPLYKYVYMYLYSQDFQIGYLLKNWSLLKIWMRWKIITLKYLNRKHTQNNVHLYKFKPLRCSQRNNGKWCIYTLYVIFVLFYFATSMLVIPLIISIFCLEMVNTFHWLFS